MSASGNAPTASGAFRKVAKELERVRAGPCGKTPEAVDQLDALEEALQRGDADEVRSEVEQLAALDPASQACSVALGGLRERLQAHACRSEAAALVEAPGARRTIEEGTEEAAVNAMLAAAATTPSARPQLERCVALQPLRPEARRRAEEQLRRLHAARGSEELPTASVLKVLEACDDTPAAELVRSVLGGGERSPDAKDLTTLAEGLAPTTATERLCVRRLKAAANELEEEACRGAYRGALGASAPATASLELLEQLLEHRVRRELEEGDGLSETWHGHPQLAGCLRRSGASQAAARILAEAGESAGSLGNLATGEAGRRQATLQASAEAAGREASRRCAKIMARAPGDALDRFLKARALPELRVAKRELDRRLRDTRAQLQGLQSHGVNSALAAHSHDVGACSDAVAQAHDARTQSICVPKVAATAAATGSEREYLEKIALSASPELQECAEVVAPDVAAWRRWRGELVARRAAAPTPKQLAQAEAKKELVCAALAKLAAAPTSPAATLPLLALSGLPPWSQSYAEWLSGSGEHGLRARNGAAVMQRAPIAGLAQLKKLLPGLWARRPWGMTNLLSELAARPCVPEADEVHGNAWWALTMRVFGDAESDEVPALADELRKAQEAMIAAGLAAAEEARRESAAFRREGFGAALLGVDYEASDTDARRTVYQRLWEAWLAHALAHPKGRLLAAGQRISFDLETPEDAKEFLRLEILFFLVLFDSYGRLAKAPVAKALPSWMNLRHGFGHWEAPDDPARLAPAAQVALAQSVVASEHPKEGESWQLYFDSAARAAEWRNKRSQIAKGEAYLPAPVSYPLVPFASSQS
jgi:hypothetical protein